MENIFSHINLDSIIMEDFNELDYSTNSKEAKAAASMFLKGSLELGDIQTLAIETGLIYFRNAVNYLLDQNLYNIKEANEAGAYLLTDIATYYLDEETREVVLKYYKNKNEKCA